MAQRHSKYEEVKQFVKEQILTGKLSAGDRVPSEYELVEQLSVGRGQTRQALRELEIEGFLVRRQGSGSYVAPNPGVARSPIAEAPRTIMAAFPTYSSRYIREVLEGFMGCLFEAGYGVTNYNLVLDEDAEVRFLDSVPESGIAGLLIWLGNETENVRNAMLRLREWGVPVVMADRYFSDVGLDFVVSDNLRIGRELTESLIRQGHERIGIAISESDLATSQFNRIAGYEQALAEAGLEIDPRWRVSMEGSEHIRRASINSVMALRRSPTAFMCINDIIAGKMARELRALNYRLPEDVALATVDDGCFSDTEPLQAIALSQQGVEIGLRSAELLLERISNAQLPAKSVFIAPGEVKTLELHPNGYALGSERREVAGGGDAFPVQQARAAG